MGVNHNSSYIVGSNEIANFWGHAFTTQPFWMKLTIWSVQSVWIFPGSDSITKMAPGQNKQNGLPRSDRNPIWLDCKTVWTRTFNTIFLWSVRVKNVKSSWNCEEMEQWLWRGGEGSFLSDRIKFTREYFSKIKYNSVFAADQDPIS